MTFVQLLVIILFDPGIGTQPDSEFVSKVHVCVICKGKDSTGRIDREANNLSFR